MIFKTLYTRKSAGGWIGYIGYKSKISRELEREFKGVFNGMGRKVSRADVEWIINTSEENKLARMFIFSPAKPMHPIHLSEYTREAIWKFLNTQSRNSVRFVYALHYNTPHPHSHAVLTSYLPDDLVLYEKEIEVMRKIASEIFGEEIDIHRKVEKIGERNKGSVNRRMRMIAEWERAIEEESKNEIKEMRDISRNIKSVDDVMNFISL